ncbi:MAG TPA: AAA family ATPase [Verrucomicrobiae bacterium]|nr:AAA family ATPase [Verrucomicrobiae bacterium]
MDWNPKESRVPKEFEEVKKQFLDLEERTRKQMAAMLASSAVSAEDEAAAGKDIHSRKFDEYLTFSLMWVFLAFMDLDEIPSTLNYRMFCEAQDLFRTEKRFATVTESQLRDACENFHSAFAAVPRVESEPLPAMPVLEQYDALYNTHETQTAQEIFMELAEIIVNHLALNARDPKTYLERFRKMLELTAQPTSAQTKAGAVASATPPPAPPDLNKLLAELDALTGLARVKADVHQLTNYIKVEQMRKTKGLKTSDVSLHMVFYGNPGTGKTTVARLIAKIYWALGVVNKGHLVEVDRSGLVAGYVGQTAIKVNSVVEKAIGGVLFIDEAYALKMGDSADFGQEAIDVLLKLMEDRRDQFVVVVAGYPDEMKNFLSSNPGMRSRFNKYLEFEDYTPEELMTIFEGFCKSCDYRISPEARKVIQSIFLKAYGTRDKTFGNGRFARNLFEKIVENQANRVVSVQGADQDTLMMVQPEDIPPPGATPMA